ncbi:MAG: hypothetical protein AVDCRST_MAG41-552, partial [uncultured Corynebacteriales bacterium]
MTSSGPVQAGVLLAGRYRLVEPIPDAGAGRTWLVRDDIGNRELVARAVLVPPGLPPVYREAVRQRVLHDAGLLARLRHPGVARIIDAVADDGIPWVITEVLPGRRLGDVIRSDGPLPPTEAARIGLEVLDALVAGAGQRVPHGDVTPENVLLEPDGTVVVTNFATTPVDGTATPGFEAPERAFADGPGSVGMTADLWSLGATLYVATQARLPFPPGRPGRGLDGLPCAEELRPLLTGLLDPNPSRRPAPATVQQLLQRAVGTAASITAGLPSAPVRAA